MMGLLLGTIVLILGTCSSRAETPLLGWGVVPPDQRDSLNESAGAIGSGLAWDRAAGAYLFVSDRGPADGKMEYHPRFGSFTIASPVNEQHLAIKLGESTHFRSADGEIMTGLIPAGRVLQGPSRQGKGWCIDPEAIAPGPDGTIYVSDEYGPFLYQFKRDGSLVRIIKAPEHYTPQEADGRVDYGDSDKIVFGRVPNRGFEGMTVTPGGTRAVLMLQSALAQDGGKDSPYTRILVLDLESGRALHEYAYRFENPAAINGRLGLKKKRKLAPDDFSISEITALSDDQFLVLERDNRGADGSDDPKEPIYKVIHQIDLGGATDLLAETGQPYSQRPGTGAFRRLDLSAPIVPVRKTMVTDLLSASRQAAGFPANQMGAKWEGLALSAAEANGGRTLLVACDNDFMNPELFLQGRPVRFSAAKRPLATQMFLFAFPRREGKE